MNNINNHELIKNTKGDYFCVNCELYITHSDFYLFDCKILLEKSTSHKWVDFYVTANLKSEFRQHCKICNIIGYITKKKITIVDINQIYTCNEWLMIKANE